MNPSFYLGLILLSIIVLGVAGNGISLLVWTRGRLCRISPCAIFLRALAVSDTIALCIPALNEAVGLITGSYPNHQNVILCKMEVVGRHFGLLVSSWIIVFFSIERTISILRPLNQQWCDDRRNSMKLIGGIIIIMILLNVPYGLVYDIVPVDHFHNRSGDSVMSSMTGQNDVVFGVNSNNLTNDSGWRKNILDQSMTSFGDNTDALNVSTDKCSSKATNSDNTRTLHTRDNIMDGTECSSDPNSLFSFYNWYHIWLMDFTLIFLTPFSIITACNFIVICCIVHRHKRLPTSWGSRRAVAVTKRAIAVSVMHCITTGPFTVFVLVPGLPEKAFGVKYSTEYYILTGVMIFAYLNHGINYILYSVFGSDFRRDCSEIFRYRPHWLGAYSTCDP